MGIRRTVLETLLSTLDQLPIIDNTGRRISIVSKLFDYTTIDQKRFPLFSLVPAPEDITLVDTYGTMPDSVYRVALIGYTFAMDGENLFSTSEDIIESIVRALTLGTNVDTFITNNFSIVKIGPVINEQMDEGASIAYISIPMETQFVQ